MSANVETAYLARTPAWHGLGNVSANALTSGDARKLAGLDWHVALRSVAVSTTVDGKRTWTLDPDRKAVVRESDGRIYGIFSDSFRPIQNEVLFGIADGLVGEGCLYETALALNGGARVVVLAQLPNTLLIAGEEVRQYLMVANGHDGSLALTVKPVDERVVCCNTFAIAMGERAATYRARHTAGLTAQKAAEEARRFIGLHRKHAENFTRSANELLAASFSPADYAALCAQLLPRPDVSPAERADGLTAPTQRRILNWETQLDAMVSELQAPDLANVAGTKWAALNAVVAYVDHGAFRGASAEKRFLRAVDDTTGLKSHAYQLLRA